MNQLSPNLGVIYYERYVSVSASRGQWSTLDPWIWTVKDPARRHFILKSITCPMSSTRHPPRLAQIAIFWVLTS